MNGVRMPIFEPSAFGTGFEITSAIIPGNNMSYIQVPPDSTGKKIHTMQNVVDGATVQTQVIHISGSNPDYHLEVDRLGSTSVRFAEGQPIMSGFGQLKIQQDRALGVYESSMDSYDDLFSINLLNGGTSTYVAHEASTILGVTSESGSSSIRTTNRYHYYLPGTSNYIKMTISTGDLGKTNNIRRWGAMDDSDGLFFELHETTMRAVVRSSTTGSIVEDFVAQSDWNTDKLDGTGISGFLLDPMNVNIYWMDYQWLGAGRVRFGIVAPNGARLVCHSFEHANNHTLPYMRTGTLPLRTENVNIGSTGSASELREVCLSIYAEGPVEDYTFWRNSDVSATTNVTGSGNHIVSVKSKSAINGKHNAVNVYPETLNAFVSGGAVAIMLYQNTVATGGTWIDMPSTVKTSTDTTVNVDTASKFFTIFLGEGTHSIDISKYFEINDEGILYNINGVTGETGIWSFLGTKLSGTTVAVTLNLCSRELW